MKKFWNWNTDNDAGRILTIDGTIAEESWFDDEITPKLFKNELASGKGNVTLWLNSPGGDCVAASQIYAMLMDYAGQVSRQYRRDCGFGCLRDCYGRHNRQYGTDRTDDDPQSVHDRHGRHR